MSRKRPSRNTKSICDFRNSSSESKYRKSIIGRIGSAIISLLFRSGPSAIFLGIWSIIIDSIDRFSRWSFAHVFEEVLKRGYPSFTNDYSAPCVMFIFRILRIAASRLHAAPRLIRVAFRHSMRSEQTDFNHFITNTSAAFNNTGSYIVGLIHAILTTGTKTPPERCACPSYWRTLYDGQFPEFLTS